MDKTLNVPAVKSENAKDSKTVTAAKAIDLNKSVIKEAITKGKALIKEGKSKVEAAMMIFEAIKDEDKEVIIAALIEGATLTEKGAVTYFYNCSRKAKKLAKPA